MFNPDYIPLVKNLRGIVYGVGTNEENRSLSWLVRHFRYRQLGVPPALWQSIPKRGRIIHISPPFPQIEAIAERISRETDVDFPIVEATVLASTFCSPIVLLSKSAAEQSKKLAIFAFRAENQLTDRDIKFCLRLCDYAMTDLYAQSAEQSVNVLCGKWESRKVINSRRTLAKEDALRRFWRLGDGTQGEPFVLYLDILPLVIKLKMQEISELPVLSIIPAILIKR